MATCSASISKMNCSGLGLRTLGEKDLRIVQLSKSLISRNSVERGRERQREREELMIKKKKHMVVTKQVWLPRDPQGGGGPQSSWVDTLWGILVLLQNFLLKNACDAILSVAKGRRAVLCSVCPE